ncbi:phage head-tail connector protein [Listeria booriae]|uniref:phage head-tail connector protein n=1 Tax=Listeria booriae TaxID=1552123 RepID=UPI001C8A0078|nr:phage head-tail connector protein [Listeria booriae]
MADVANDILSRVHVRLSITDSSKDELLGELIKGVTDNIAIRVGLVAFPAVLSSIAVDASVSAYNRIGSEGLTSESIDVISSSFIDDLLEPYDKQFERYISGLAKDEGSKHKGVTFY